MHGEKRLLIVARRFWPCTNDAALRLRRMTELLEREGWQTTVLTPRWHSSWSFQLMLNGTSVVRVDAPPVSALRQMRYQQNLKLWASQNVHRFDVVYCDQADWDAETVLHSLQGCSQATIVRLATGEQETGGTDAILRVCSMASTVLVSTKLSHQRAVAMGLKDSQIRRVSDWYVPAIDRSTSACREARGMLSDINGDLHLARGERLIVVPGEVTSRWQIDFLIRAIGMFMDQQRGLRLWILGDSLEKNSSVDSIHDLLRDYGIHRIVALPGVFTSIDTILQAADLCLFPGRDCGLDFLIPSCISSGIPILAARSSELESHLGPAATSLCFEPESADDLLRTVRHWWACPGEFSEAARSAQRFLRRQSSAAFYDSSQAIRTHLPRDSTANNPTASLNERLRPA